jgi:hypothetical protein
LGVAHNHRVRFPIVFFKVFDNAEGGEGLAAVDYDDETILIRIGTSEQLLTLERLRILKSESRLVLASSFLLSSPHQSPLPNT